MEPFERVREVCLRQHNVISRSQALAVGMSERQIDRRVAAGVWVRLELGVYLARLGPITTTQRNIASLLLGGDAAMVTARQAMALHGVRIAAPLPTSILIPHSQRANSTRTTHIIRSRDLPRPFGDDVIRYAPIDRAVLDAARYSTSIDEIREVIAAAVQQGRLSVDSLIRSAREIPRLPPGVRQALAEVGMGARSVPEAEVVRKLGRAGFTNLLFNPRVFDGSRFLCSPDVLDEQTWTALEIDSVQFHFSPADYQRTQERRRRAIAAGLIVIAATPAEIYRDFDGVMTSFRAAIAQGAKRMRPTNLRVA